MANITYDITGALMPACSSLRVRLRKYFGPGLLALIDASPLLQADLRKLEKLRVPVKRLKNRTDAYCLEYTDASPHGEIYIGDAASNCDQALFLAHEAYHILHGTTTSNPNTRQMSRERYVSKCLQEETRALMHEAKVSAQLIDAGFRLPYKHLFYFAAYLRGGYRAIHDLLLLDTSADGRGGFRQLFVSRYEKSRVRRKAS